MDNIQIINKIKEALPNDIIVDVIKVGSNAYVDNYNDYDLLVITESSEYKILYVDLDGIKLDLIITSKDEFNKRIMIDITSEFITSYHSVLFTGESLFNTNRKDISLFLSLESKWKDKMRDYVYNSLLSKNNGYYRAHSSVPRAFYHIIIQLEIYKQKTFDIDFKPIVDDIRAFRTNQNYDKWKTYCDTEFSIIHNQ